MTSDHPHRRQAPSSTATLSFTLRFVVLSLVHSTAQVHALPRRARASLGGSLVAAGHLPLALGLFDFSCRRDVAACSQLLVAYGGAAEGPAWCDASFVEALEIESEIESSAR